MAFVTAALLAGLRAAAPGAALSYSVFQTGRGSSYIYLDPFTGRRLHTHRLLLAAPEADYDTTAPDGSAYIMSRPTEGGVDLFLLQPDGKSVRQITHFDQFPPIEHEFRYARSNTYPVWSPDGAWIAFVSSDWLANMDIFIVRPDGSGLRRVAADVGTPMPLRLRWSSVAERDYPALALLAGLFVLGAALFALPRPSQEWGRGGDLG
jgi:Tol biopolymer transport system component